MSKDTKGKAARRPIPQDKTLAADDTVRAGAGTTAGALGQTEAFEMAPQEDDAADFLLGDDSAPEESQEETQEESAQGEAAEVAATQVVDKPVKKSLNQNEQTEFFPKKTEKKPASKKPIRKAQAEEEAGEEETAGNAPHDRTEVNSPEEEAKAAAPPAQKATVLGDFKLLKKLGQGGMGSVYKAHQISLDREVAVKVLARELSNKPAFVQRFQREAKVMAKLDHPNVLRCHGVDSAQGYHFLAMEFVDGGSVEGFFKKMGRFSIGDALYIIITTAHALEHAHELGLIHRDIKPDNILLTSKGVLKLADLGLAKATDDDLGLTKTGTGAGTPYYMAPEQARDAKHVDGRVDIYALGVMLYAFLTGEMPFKGETLVEVITAKDKGKFTPMRRFNDEVPERLDLIVDKLLAPKPEHRYGSCAELIADLEELDLAHDHLSFIQGAAPAAARPVAGRPAAQKTLAGPAKQKTLAPKGNATLAPKEAPKPEARAPELWYWSFVNDEDRKVTKKLGKEQLITLIKSGSIDTDAQVSRNAKTGFRAVATYGEFLPFLQKNIITEKVEKKGEKYRDMYKQIEEEEKSRQRWRWLHNLYIKLGGGVGFLIWMGIVAVFVVGGYFGVKWLLEYLGTTVADKAGLK